MDTNRPVRILIAGHDSGLRTQLVNLVLRCQSAQVVGEVCSAAQTLDLAQRLRPDMVLLDMAISGSNGLTVTRQLKSQRPTIQVVLLTSLNAREYLGVARGSGVDQCLNRQEIEKRLPPLIATLAAHSNGS